MASQSQHGDLVTSRIGPKSADLSLAVAYILKHYKRYLLLTLALWVPLLVYILLLPTMYTAEIKVLPPESPHGSAAIADLAGVASSFGINLASGGTGYEQYPTIVESRSILDPIISAGLTIENRGHVDIPKLLGISEEDVKKRNALARRMLAEKVISSRIDRVSQVMQVRVKLADAHAAASLANVLADALDSFNKIQFIERASEQRRFIEGRLVEIGAALSDAEEELKEFREGNRMWQTSPALQLQEERLVRDVSIQTALYTELRRQLEIEKLEEHRNTNTIRILDRADIPVLPSGPSRARLSLLSLFLVACVVGLSIGIEGLRKQSTAESELSNLSS